MYYTNNGTDLYQGDIQIGDREATTKEVEVYEAKKELGVELQEAQSYLDSTDWIKSKYVELVVMKKTMTEEEFNLKYEVELAKMDEARSIL